MSVRLSVRSATLVLSAGVLAVTGSVVTGAPASAESSNKVRTQLTTTLSGTQESPGPGDVDGTGTGVLDVKVASGRICYELTVSDIAPARAAHLHEAARGVAGPVIVTLLAPTDGTSRGCFTDRELAQELFDTPADYYLNVHNADFPDGAVRAQLG